MKDVPYNLWGVISIPNPNIFYELILGPSRGLLYTQPYVLLLPFCLIAIVFWGFKEKKTAIASRDEKSLWIFTFLGLAGLLFMNAGFGGWHGGHTAGPRYLSAILPCVGLLAGLIYDRIGISGRGALWLCLLFAVILRGFIYSYGVLVPPFPMWNFFMEHFRDSARAGTAFLRFGIYVLALVIAVTFALKRARSFYMLVGK
jgi:hypothetical protein